LRVTLAGNALKKACSARRLFQTSGMVPPIEFLKLVEHIRIRFAAERGLRAESHVLCPRGFTPFTCAAAIAALVNAGFLQWADGCELMRSDVEVEAPPRRTA
jgi:hypothetical protein